MRKCFDIIRRTSRVNYILICLFISLSITSHLIAYRLVSFFGISVFPSSLTYMLCFVILNMMSAYNPNTFIWLVVIMESVANFIMIFTTHTVIHLPHPTYFSNELSYVSVFAPIGRLYWANVLGNLVGFVINVLIFNYLYKGRGILFFFSSITSSFIVVVIYTAVTDYFAFDFLYKSHISELVIVNIISNLFFVAFFSIPSVMVVKAILNYIDRGS